MHINQKIEYWKNRLLDIGKRNRLINCSMPNPGKRVFRSALLIYEPSLISLWDLVSEGETPLIFPIPILDSEKSDSNILTQSQPDIFRNGVRTNQKPTESYKTLHRLMKKAKMFTEEKGLNALYLAFGFLLWKENGTEGQEMRSPLILVPVSMSQEGLNEPILLSRSDDEITVNSALAQRLLNDFGISLPNYDEVDDWQDYLSKVQYLVKDLKWHVDYSAAQLSLFSFQKINMYKDMEKNNDKIALHQIIRALNGEGFENDDNFSDIITFDHDAVEPQEIYSVLDADSSQQDAILLAKRGASFVLQGPPGTGKSQTITNIIAELIAINKKVLFVSEKMAALEVVNKRLHQNGLDNFCLTLHHHNAKRREVLDQIEISLKLSRNKAALQPKAFNTLYQLKEARNFLNNYVGELHTAVEPLGKSIFQVNGLLSSYNEYNNIDYVQQNAANFSPNLLAQCEIALDELTRIVNKSGYQQNNPWTGCVLSSVTHEFRQQFTVDADKLLSYVKEGTSLFDEIIKFTGATTLPITFSGTQNVIDIFLLSKKSPNVPSNWLNLNIDEQIESTIKCIDSKSKLNGLDAFCTRFENYANSLLSTIQQITLSTRSESNENRGILNTEYVSSYEKFISLKPTGNVVEQLSVFSEIFPLYQKLIDDEINLTSIDDQITERISSINQNLEVERRNLEQKQHEWMEIERQLLEDFDESVLLVDAVSLISRYRTVYRSALSRFVSSKYRADKKNLLLHCKRDMKMSYSDALLFLDRIVNAQNKKFDFEKQSELVSKAIGIKNEQKVLLSINKMKLLTISEQKNIKKKELSISSDIIISSISSCILDNKSHLSSQKDEFADYCQSLGDTLKIDISLETNFQSLISKLEWTMNFQKYIDEFNICAGFANKVCEGDSENIKKFNVFVESILNWKNSIQPWLNKFSTLFESNYHEKICNKSLMNLMEIVQNCKNNFASLEYLIDFRNAERRLTQLGIDDYLEKAKALNLASNEIIPVFKKCFYRSWLDATLPNFPAVDSFRRERQDGRIAQFKALDKSHLEISKAALTAKLISRLPNIDAFSAGTGEVAILRREMAKQRKLMPIRKLIAALPNLLPALKPCMMMSPLSVSTYLGSSDYEFDTVIFDEASQIRTEDAICSIFRAKQVIIAGDNKQLPPTDFFNASISDSGEYDDSDEDDINDTGAYESLLDEAAMLMTQTLLWHYRSKHEHLIAFSNAKIYNGNLITFPSSVDKAKGLGVEYIHVPGGIYDRGGKNGNKKEAARIAELVFENFRKYPNRSLGVIAFGEIQQIAIEEEIIRKRRENPQYEAFFRNDKEEVLFIKNLETVQGDERDTIIFSIGYAPDASGKFIMNFGPLSRVGGERRLNVAVTRARYNLKLVGSISPTDIDPDRASGAGPKLLRQYIDFAINGVQAIWGETSESDGTWFDSDFEVSVYNYLTTNGYEVSTQVGCSGYRIDLAVRHPKYNGRYAIGIECDGAAYHSVRTARERDRLRQSVLEDMGWKIYRIWSTDWIKDIHTEGARLLEAIDFAINNYREDLNVASDSKTLSANFLDIRPKSDQESIQEKYKNLRSRYAGNIADDIPISDYERTMLRILENSYGLDKAALFKETALYGYLWQRQGSTIKSKFERAYNNLLSRGQVSIIDGKIKICETK